MAKALAACARVICACVVVISAVFTFNSSAVADVILSYDELGRLTNAFYDDDDRKAMRYTYDKVGNRTNVKVLTINRPIARDDSITVSLAQAAAAGGFVDFNPLGNDATPSGGRLTLIDAQASGQLLQVEVASGQYLRISPLSNSGNETIQYTVLCTNGGAASAVVTVNFIP